MWPSNYISKVIILKSLPLWKMHDVFSNRGHNQSLPIVSIPFHSKFFTGGANKAKFHLCVWFLSNPWNRGGIDMKLVSKVGHQREKEEIFKAWDPPFQ